MRTIAATALLVVSLAAGLAHAAGELPLQVPSGWDGRRQDGAFVMTPRDVGAGKLYTLLVIDLVQKVGSSKGLLEAATATLGTVGTFKPGVAPAHARNDQGWEYDVVIGTLEKDGKSLMATAMGLKHGDEEGAIIVIADSLETMQKYAEPFATMIRTMGARAAPAAAPAPAPAAGSVDLRYTVPAGWSSKPVDNSVLLEKTESTFYEKYTYRVLIMPSEPLRASLRATFLDNWNVKLLPTLQSSIAPLPFMRRLKSGTVIAYDTDVRAKVIQSGASVNGGLILVARGKRYVPIMVFFFGAVTADKLDADLATLLQSAEIPGAGSDLVPMFAASEMTGEWSTSSASYASYVTASGAYAGDASISTAEYLSLGADGAFKRTFMGISSSSHLKETDAGTWKLDDDTLRQAGRTANTYTVLAVGADPKAGAFLVLGTYSGAVGTARFWNPRGMFQGTWFKRKE